MSYFNLNELKKENVNPKIKVFIDYLYERFGVTNSEQFDNDYFMLFNENDLIESLEYYIHKNKVTAKITANNYITYIQGFFKRLSEQYNIKNEIFINIDLNNSFLNKSREIISKLKDSESKEIASDEQFEVLNDGINTFLHTINDSDIHDEINKCKNKELSRSKLYLRFVSVIAIKLVMKYALKNLTVISLEIHNLDMENKTIKVNDFILPFDEELVQLFNRYIKFRKYILDLYSTQDTKLFIRHNAEPFIKMNTSRNVTDYGAFFIIMKDYIDTWSAEIFASRRILEMIDKGIEIRTISKLTERSEGKCIELQSTNIIDDNDRLNHFFLKDFYLDNKVTAKKRDFFTCPFCGRELKAISDKWVLIQYKDDNIKYIACKECKGSGKSNR